MGKWCKQRSRVWNQIPKLNGAEKQMYQQILECLHLDMRSFLFIGHLYMNWCEIVPMGCWTRRRFPGVFNQRQPSWEPSSTSTTCFWGSCHRTRTVVATCTVVMLPIGGGTEFWGHICNLYSNKCIKFDGTLMAKLFLMMFQWCFPSNWPERPVSNVLGCASRVCAALVFKVGDFHGKLVIFKW